MTTPAFRDDITGERLLVSNKSSQTIRRALVAAHRDGAITDHEYAMTYAEVCEIGRLPQAFGGGPVDSHLMEEWQRTQSWRPTP